MADCFSLENATELARLLRFSCPKHGEEICVEQQAADVIEQLLAENAKLKERCELLQGNNILLRGCVDKYNIDEIERLREENAALRAELDVAIIDLKKQKYLKRFI